VPARPTGSKNGLPLFGSNEKRRTIAVPAFQASDVESRSPSARAAPGTSEREANAGSATRRTIEALVIVSVPRR
jgi:hypothetical protein